MKLVLLAAFFAFAFAFDPSPRLWAVRKVK
jgi:hypothetical protein